MGITCGSGPSCFKKELEAAPPTSNSRKAYNDGSWLKGICSAFRSIKLFQSQFALCTPSHACSLLKEAHHKEGLFAREGSRQCDAETTSIYWRHAVWRLWRVLSLHVAFFCRAREVDNTSTNLVDRPAKTSRKSLSTKEVPWVREAHTG